LSVLATSSNRESPKHVTNTVITDQINNIGFRHPSQSYSYYKVHRPQPNSIYYKFIDEPHHKSLCRVIAITITAGSSRVQNDRRRSRVRPQHRDVSLNAARHKWMSYTVGRHWLKL
jgi:hypothetical protein